MGEYALSVGLPEIPAPEEWEWVKLSDVARLESGHTPSRRVPEYWDGNIPWLGIKDAKEHNGEIISQTRECTNQLGLDNSSARLLPRNTVCLSRTASVGYVIIMGREMATSQDFVNWICSDKIDPQFLKHLLMAEKNAYRKFSSGAVHQTIYFPEVKAFHVCLPPLSEQKRIVAILDEAFGAIARAKENAARNLANARELFNSYLNRVFTEKGEGWKDASLVDLCVDDRVITYGVIKLGDAVTDGVPCLRTSNVKKLKIDLNGMKHIEPSLSESYGRTILQGGEVLVNVRGTLGGVAIVSEKMVGWNVSREVAVVPVNTETVDPQFVAFWVAAKNQQDWLTGVKKGAAYTGINIEDLRRLPVHFPNKREQTKLVNKLESVKDSCRKMEMLHEQKIVSLDELKQSILQKAFTGQLTSKTKELELVP